MCKVSYMTTVEYRYDPACMWYVKTTTEEVDGVLRTTKTYLTYYWAKTSIPTVRLKNEKRIRNY
jgi:hypothetical protein